jgi:hypothetical protein
MSRSLALDVADLATEPLTPGRLLDLTLESVPGNNLMTEVGASGIGSCPVFVCSCCCCCS